MPFKSENQRRYLWANHPDIAKHWASEIKRKLQAKRKPKKRAKK